MMDAEQLVDVVQSKSRARFCWQKLECRCAKERDMAVGNAEELFKGINQANADKTQFESMNAIYRDILRQRGGVSLTVQDFAIKSLPKMLLNIRLDFGSGEPK